MACEKIQVTLERIKDISSNIYGFKPMMIRPLGGFDDANFYIKHENGRDEFVLKILNELQSIEPSQTLTRIDVMNHLVKKGARVPTIVRTNNDQLYSIIQLEYVNCRQRISSYSGDPVINEMSDYESTLKKHLIWLQNFIPGTMYCNEGVTDVTPQLYFDIGRYVANLHKQLSDCPVNVRDTLSVTEEWSLNNLLNQRYLLDYIHDLKQKNILDNIVTQFEDYLPLVKQCRSGLIHGDLNDENLLLTRDKDDRWQLEAFIDYGDCVNGYFVFDLAIAISYFAVFNKGIDTSEVCQQILAGYQTKLKLPDVDKSVLKICVCARLAQSIMMGNCKYQKNNAVTQALKIPNAAWPFLNYLLNMSIEDEKRLWWKEK